MSKKNNTALFKSLYTSQTASIKDRNTGKFWSEKFESPVFFENESPATKHRIKITASFIPLKAGKILDVGAGVGLVEEYLGKKGREIDWYGIDVSDRSVNLLKERFDGNFKKGSIYRMDYRENSFDAVLALEVLEHLSPSKTIDVLRNIAKILKPRGDFIGSVPLNENLWSLAENENSHLREYSKDLIKKELELSGFKWVEGREIIAFPSLYNVKSFIAKYFLTKRWKPNDLIFKAQKL